MASEQIVLFDLPSKPPVGPWSYNPWKSRMLLNYKGLDYRTEWTEYPDIKPRLESHLPPNEKGTDYTIPTIRLPDDTYVMDSRKIADAINARYPSPPLTLDSPALARIEALKPQIMGKIRGAYQVGVYRRLLGDASKPYWRRTRKLIAALTPEQLEGGEGPEWKWAEAGPLLAEVTALLGESEGGPFFLGGEVSYVDFVWASFLLFLQTIGEDVLEAALAHAGDAKVHRDLLEAVGPWTQRRTY
ncbi:putative glutathione S-transferase [Lasiosphaeris hirsuta]|uniref:Glutathione S-transferase n=1 Tax=Lasiosphaeris hirsuta TaxID=260670 RepID=A0AA40BCW7_9PEZI|nr:putative glutathione S-transferase [Lasiosphaeris hirsuta]